ncbi:MAG: hypothetical protein HON70_20740, partial [Lentisphaerae bacterium]|nr:hypothetical protein [Lentisphaerota bacterium]
EFAAMVGNGGVASSGDQVNVDGTLQPAVYGMFDQAFGFVEAREKLLLDARSVTDTAILAPVPRADYPPEHAEGPAMLGAHKALLESHVQFDILSSLDIDKIDAYQRIVLTEPNDFGPDVMERLRAWVEAGGDLIAVGSALITNTNAFELAGVFGVDYLEPSVFSVSHFRPGPEVAGDTYDLPLQCRGRSYKVIPTTADVLADYIYPQIEGTATYAFRHNVCPPPADDVSPYPFATVNRYGKGRAVYVAGSVFKIYWETNHHWLRQFIEGIWQHLDPEPLYRVDMSGIIEANLMQRPNDELMLNLIHYQVGHQSAGSAIPSIERVHPIRGVPCEVKATGVARVVLEPEGAEIPFVEDNGYVTFTVPEIEYMAIVRLVMS